MISVFCDSIAYRDDAFSILYLLEKSRWRLPGVTCVVCEKFLDLFSEDSQGLRTGRVSDTRTVTKLVFRTYNEHQNDEWTTRSLNLIDRLCLEGIDEAREELDASER